MKQLPRVISDFFQEFRFPLFLGKHRVVKLWLLLSSTLHMKRNKGLTTKSEFFKSILSTENQLFFFSLYIMLRSLRSSRASVCFASGLQSHVFVVPFATRIAQTRNYAAEEQEEEDEEAIKKRKVEKLKPPFIFQALVPRRRRMFVMH